MNEIPTSFDDLKGGRFLKQDSVGPKGKVLTIRTMQKVNVAPDDQPEDHKWVLYFDQDARGLVLNNTNIDLLRDACKSMNPQEWVGKHVKLFVDPTVSFGGRKVGGIRVKAPEKNEEPLPF